MLKKHMERYPDYKFSPSRKSSRKKSDEGEIREGGDYIRHLREKYMGMPGPSTPSPRARKPKSRKRASPPELQIPHLPPMHHAASPLTYPVDQSSYPFGAYPPQVYQSYAPSQMPVQPPAPFLAPGQEIDFAALTQSYMQQQNGSNSSSRTTSPSPVSSSSSSEGSSSGTSSSGEEEVAQPVDHDKVCIRVNIFHFASYPYSFYLSDTNSCNIWQHLYASCSCYPQHQSLRKRQPHAWSPRPDTIRRHVPAATLIPVTLLLSLSQTGLQRCILLCPFPLQRALESLSRCFPSFHYFISNVLYPSRGSRDIWSEDSW